MAQDQNIIQDAIDRDVSNGTLRIYSPNSYDIYIEIDCDCEELLDACDLDYKQCKDDETQNEVLVSLTKDEFEDVVNDVAQRWTLDHTFPCEQDIACALLNPELGEYTTKVTIYTPSGDVIMFK